MSGAGSAGSASGRGGRGAPKRIRTAAANPLYRDVIQATGVQRLTQEANVSKCTFYQHIASNTDLVAECLRGIHEAGGTLSERANRHRDRNTAPAPAGDLRWRTR